VIGGCDRRQSASQEGREKGRRGSITPQWRNGFASRVAKLPQLLAMWLVVMAF